MYQQLNEQRYPQEYEKLISFSGTPTAVWRRTGEIVLVGKEFSLLTQWSKEALLDKKTFIYEVRIKKGNTSIYINGCYIAYG